MAIITRYFSTTSAGAADGTTWADRAALFTAGVWSPVLITFAFNGTDSLNCLLGPGTYSCGASLASGLFANPPSNANPLMFSGCNSSGTLLTIPDPDWVSNQPAWDDSTLPVIATTTNIITINLANCNLFLIKLTATGSTTSGSVVSAVASMDWCVGTNSGSNTASGVVGAVNRSSNSVFTHTATSYSHVMSGTTVPAFVNCRFEGVTGSSGNRRGVQCSANSLNLVGCTIVNNGGEGVMGSGAGAEVAMHLYQCTIANNGATGVKTNATAAQTGTWVVERCMITGNGTAGIDGQSAGRVVARANRLRDNTTDITGLGNYPVDLDNYTTDSDDASEYVSTGANGDFRIKTGAAIETMGFGANAIATTVTGGRRRIIGG